MRQDVHQNGDYYTVRSLYFDDQRDSYMDENDAGIDLRKKFRIRIYDPSQNTMHLELKEKIHGFTKKSACSISKEECLALIDRTPSPLFDDRRLFNTLKLEMRTSHLQPKVIIEYERTAFISGLGNIRITFDRNITASTCCQDFFCTRPSKQIPLLPTGLHPSDYPEHQSSADSFFKILFRQTCCPW